MDHPAFLEMSELTSIVRLNDLRKVSEIGNCSVNEIDRRVAADFLIWIDEPFSRRFVDHGILVEALLIRPDITGCWNVFHIHLPLDTWHRWGVIWFQMSGFLFGRWRFLTIAQAYKDPIQ